ncbi:hypothetical protein C7K55_07055 [Cyanobium usitatum str. Tous]|uniref:Uncharacterized protein n=1 Tax=Cyanobium usitatum str. Tous TaxID=2116684 RepID=A0A2P7MX20_9CYAN|nr:hypothetical protein C7K55_07055 [Cyanobium usitatum str. Tous]
MTNLSYLEFKFLNLEFALSKGLNNVRRGIRLGIERHYFLFPFPLLIDRRNKFLFKCLNALASPMSNEIFQWRFARQLTD